MNSLAKVVGLSAFVILLAAASGNATPINPLGGGTGSEHSLQQVLNQITTSPIPGVSSVDASGDINDALDDSFDSYWSVGGAGGSLATIIIELAGFAGTNTFGIYDAANPSNKVQIFAGNAGPGQQAIVSIMLDGSVHVNFADTGVDFASGNLFGFYLGGTGHPTWYSDTSLNDDGADHMVAFQGVGDTIQIAGFAPGLWLSNEYILGWEDLPSSRWDWDYQDFVVIVESVTPIPEPTSLVLLGAGLLGLGVFRLRKYRR